jgi:hypothetical protein
MATEEIGLRYVSELSADPRRKLTRDQIDHIEEYLTLKNHDKSATDVDISDAVDHVIDNLDYYLGIRGTENSNVVF